jgi:hypothetical protein
MYEIIWTNKSKLDYFNNIDFLEKEWTNKEIERFINKTDEILEKLIKGNIKFKKTEYKEVYQVVVIKQITLFYEKNEDKIFLLRFWNNYQDIKNLSLY